MARLAAVLVVAFLAGLSAQVANGAELLKNLAGPAIALPDGGPAGGLATGPDGSLFVGVRRSGNARVAVLDPDGRFLRDWPVDDLFTARDEQLLAVGGPNGEVYTAGPFGTPGSVGSTSLFGIRVFRPDGTPVRTFGTDAGLKEVTDIEVDAAGNVYVTSRAQPAVGIPDDVVVRFDPAGNLTGRFAPDPGRPGEFSNTLPGLAVQDDGTVWVATSNPRRPLVRIAPDGTIVRAFNSWAVFPGNDDDVEDVDFSQGRLYFSGSMGEARGGERIAMAVTNTAGVRLDLFPGQAEELAVRGDRVYLAGLVQDAPATTAAGDGIGSVHTYRVTSGSGTSDAAVDLPPRRHRVNGARQLLGGGHVAGRVPHDVRQPRLAVAERRLHAGHRLPGGGPGGPADPILRRSLRDQPPVATGLRGRGVVLHGGPGRDPLRVQGRHRADRPQRHRCSTRPRVGPCATRS